MHPTGRMDRLPPRQCLSCSSAPVALVSAPPPRVARPSTEAMRTALLLAGPALAVALALLAPEALPPAAAAVLGIAAWMALWWIAEPVPLAATSLLPIALFPILGIASVRDAASPYANEIVFLFLAGFLLAAALERWNAHARIAYGMVAAIGDLLVRTRASAFAFMAATNRSKMGRST